MSPGLELRRGREGEAEVAELRKGARVLGSCSQLRHGLDSWSQWDGSLGGSPASVASSPPVLFTPTCPLLLSHKSLPPWMQSSPGWPCPQPLEALQVHCALVVGTRSPE